MNRAAVLGILCVLLCVSTASAAVIYGTLYDEGLDVVEKAIVEVDSKPSQRYVVTNGTYRFVLQSGNYIITTKSSLDEDLSAAENVTISAEGEYLIDLFLFPEIHLDFGDLSSDVSSVENEVAANDLPTFDVLKWLLGFVWVIALVIIIYAFFKTNHKRRRKEESDDELDKVVAFIKKSGGRVTQKELRKEFPLSEAKISLMVKELESKGVVEKIKKGRSNIIVLKKR